MTHNYAQPRRWQLTTLGEVAEVVTGNTPSKKEPANYGDFMPLVKPGELNHCPVYEAEDGLSHQGAKLARILPPNSVLVSCIGNLGKTGLNRVPVAFNQQINAATFRDGIVPEFGFYYLQTLMVADWMHEKASATTISILNKGKFVELPFPVAPFAEQRRIVATIEEQFSRLDAGVTALERVRANLKRYRTAVLKAAVEGRLTEAWREENPDVEPAPKLLERILKERRERWEKEQFAAYEKKGKKPPKNWRSKYKEPAGPDTGDLPELPEEWCWTTVQQIGALGEQPVLTGPFGTTLKTSDFTLTGVPVLTIGCLTSSGITFDKAVFVSEDKAADLERYRLREGDLLFSRMASVGRAGRVTANIAGSLFNYHIMRLRLAPHALLPGFYMAFVRGSSQVVRYLRRVNHGATRDGINTEQLLNMPVALPPLIEQEEIVAALEYRLSILQEVETEVEANLKRASRLRQSVLKRAFEGKLVPQDPSDEPASELLERIRRAREQASSKKPKRTQKRSTKVSPIEHAGTLF